MSYEVVLTDSEVQHFVPSFPQLEKRTVVYVSCNAAFYSAVGFQGPVGLPLGLAFSRFCHELFTLSPGQIRCSIWPQDGLEIFCALEPIGPGFEFYLYNLQAGNFRKGTYFLDVCVWKMILSQKVVIGIRNNVCRAPCTVSGL